MSFVPIWRHATVHSTSCIKVVLSSCDFFFTVVGGVCVFFLSFCSEMLHSAFVMEETWN